MLNKKNSFIVNFLFLSFITLNIFPSGISDYLFDYTFSSIPLITLIVVIYIFFQKPYFIFKNNENTSQILILIISTFIITLYQSKIENNFLIVIRYVFPILLSFLIYQYFSKNKNIELSNTFISILLFFIFLYFVQKYNFFGLNDVFCSLINYYELMSRGSCTSVTVPTFLSTEPSYHSLNVFGLYLFYKLFNPEYENNKKRNIIDVLFIINLLIIESELAKLFLLIFLTYLISKIFFNLNSILKVITSFFVIFTLLAVILIEINNINFYDKTVQSRFFYNFFALKNIELVPKKKFLNFKSNEIDEMISNENLLNIKKIPVVKYDIYGGHSFNLNSSLLYFLYDFGIFLAIPFILFNIIILKNILYYYNLEKIFLIMPFYSISVLAQSNFANILMWVIFFYVSKKK